MPGAVARWTALWGGRCLELLASKVRIAATAAPLGRQQPRELCQSHFKADLAPMSELAFSPTAQHWINVVLIWIGFGTLAGLLALVVFPLRRPVGPFWAVTLGICGSGIGLFGLGRLFPDQQFNPISPLGFLAAAVGAFILLMACRLCLTLFGGSDSRQN